MALKEQTINIRLDGGLETKTNPFYVVPPKTTVADNVVYTTNGSLRKRYGYAGLPTSIAGGGTIAAGAAVANVGGELVMSTGQNVYGYSATTQHWAGRGTDSAAGVTAAPLFNSGRLGSGQALNSATIGSYRCVVFQDQNNGALGTGQSSIGILDNATNTWLYPPTTLPNFYRFPVVVAFGAYFYVFYVDGIPTVSNTTYKYYIIDSTTLAAGFTLPAPQTLFTTLTIDPDAARVCIDAVVANGKIYVYAAWPIAAAGTSLFTFSTPGSNVFTTTALVNMSGRATITANASYIVLAGRTSAVILDTATLTESAATALAFPNVTVVCAGIGTYAGTTYVCFSTYAASSAAGVQNVGYIIGTLTAARTLTLSANYGIYPWPNQPTPQQPFSKPVFNTTSNTFLQWNFSLGQFSDTQQPTAYVASLDPVLGVPGGSGAVYARALYDQADAPYSITLVQPRTLQLPDADFFAISSKLRSLTALRLVTTPKQILPLAQGALISGSQPRIYDGVTVLGAGFDGFPELPAPASFAPAAGGAMTPNTTYFYSAVFRKTDAYGRVYYSANAAPVAVTLGAGDHSVVITPPANTGFPGYIGASSSLYRTTAADPNNYRLLVSMPGGNAPYVDTASDASLAGAELLYSQPNGGELPNDPPPAFSAAAATQDRVFVISSEDPTRVYYSKPFNPVRGVEFNASSYIIVDPATGPLVALGTIDGNIILFKRRSIYVLTGQGPDANGQGDFSQPQRIAADDGCVTPASVLSTSDGLYFQSSQGIQLLDRTLSVQYIGAPVENLLNGRAITTALYVPGPSQARFVLDNSTALVYDNFLKRWSTFSNYTGLGATLYGSAAAILTAAGVVNIETTAFTDNGAAISMVIRTGWIPLSEGLQGWGRLRRVLVLGDYKSANTATLSFAYDWGAFVDSVPFTSSTGLIGGDTVFQWRTRAPRQVMQSVQLNLVDSSITGESYDIVGLALEASMKSGTAKLPTQKSV